MKINNRVCVSQINRSNKKNYAITSPMGNYNLTMDKKDTVFFGANATKKEDVVINQWGWAQDRPISANSLTSSRKSTFNNIVEIDNNIHIKEEMYSEKAADIKANSIDVDGKAYLFGKTKVVDGFDAKNLGVYGNLEAKKLKVAGEVAIIKAQTIVEETLKAGSISTFFESVTNVKNMDIVQNANLGGQVIVANTMKVKNRLSTDGSSNSIATLSAQNLEVGGNAFLLGQTTVGETLDVGGKLLANDISVGKIIAHDDVTLEKIRKLDELIFPNKYLGQTRRLSLVSGINLENKIKLGLNAGNKLIIIRNYEDIDSVLNKFEFFKIAEEIKDGGSIYKLGKQFSPQKVKEFVEKGIIQIVKR